MKDMRTAKQLSVAAEMQPAARGDIETAVLESASRPAELSTSTSDHLNLPTFAKI